MPPPDPEALEALRAALDRSHRRAESAEIALAAALESYRHTAERAQALLGATLGVSGDPATPPANGEKLHRLLGAAGARVVAARRQLSEAHHELRSARAALRQGGG